MKLKLFSTRYRVVPDRWAGYEAQFKPWWSPFWLQCDPCSSGTDCNTSPTIEMARQVIALHRRASLDR
jgi:hypothetical protein